MIGTDATRDATLEDLVCFDLYAASRAMTAYYRPLLEELGLTYPQYLVVVLLAGRDVAAPVGEIGRELHLDHGTLTPLLRRLETAGLVTRTRSRTDERVVEVVLTARGHEVHERLAAVQCRVGEALGMPPADLRELQQVLRRLSRSVTEH